MPDQPTWLERVPNILRVLRRENAPPFLDRAAVEDLFGVRRRRAISLLHCFEGYQIGRAFLADRNAIIAFLERQLSGGAIEKAAKQKHRVTESLGQARQALTLPSIRLPSPAKLSEITFAGLPPGICLVPGKLSITFDTADDLVEKLFTLAQAFANDYDSLTDALASQPPNAGEIHDPPY